MYVYKAIKYNHKLSLRGVQGQNKQANDFWDIQVASLPLMADCRAAQVPLQRTAELHLPQAHPQHWPLHNPDFGVLPTLNRLRYLFVQD